MPVSSGMVSTATFTPAAASHGARDVVATCQEFKYVTPNPGTPIIINTAELLISDGTNVTTVWELHLYSVTQPSAQADNDVHDVVSGDRSVYLGFVPIAQTADCGSALFGHTLNVGKQVKPSGTSLFGVLVNVSGITTAAVAHKVTLHTIAAI